MKGESPTTRSVSLCLRKVRNKACLNPTSPVGRSYAGKTVGSEEQGNDGHNGGTDFNFIEDAAHSELARCEGRAGSRRQDGACPAPQTLIPLSAGEHTCSGWSLALTQVTAPQIRTVGRHPERGRWGRLAMSPRGASAARRRGCEDSERPLCPPRLGQSELQFCGWERLPAPQLPRSTLANRPVTSV